jgi:hypothetical protein
MRDRFGDSCTPSSSISGAFASMNATRTGRPPIWTIVFYLLRKGVKPPVLVLCLAFGPNRAALSSR